jgi:predicted DNA-binding protein (MmcQ/YjbR family)
VNIEKLRQICIAMPGTTEQVQWGADLVFKVGGKMFAVAATEPAASHRLAFKCSDETFSELLEVEGITPAPYLARAKWVALERFDALSDREIQERVTEAYDLVLAKLSRKAQAAIQARPTAPKPKSKRQ